jgi:hypothetical protein
LAELEDGAGISEWNKCVSSSHTTLWAEVQLLLGRSADAAAALEPLVEHCLQSGLALRQLRAQALHCRALLACGQLRRARAVAESALEAARGFPETDATLSAVLAAVAAFEGDMPRARAHLDRQISVEGYDRVVLDLGRLDLSLWEGNLESARREAEHLEQASLQAGWGYLACRAKVLAAEVALRGLWLEDAAQRLEVLETEIEDAGYAALGVWSSLLLAGLERTRGRLAEARQALLRARARTEVAGTSLESEAARIALGVLDGQPAGSHPAARLARRLLLGDPTAYRLRASSATLVLGEAQLAHVELGAYALALDLVEGRVHLGQRKIDLSRRWPLLGVLDVLSRSMGNEVSPTELAQKVWGVDYHPLRHRSVIATTVSRVRALVGADLVGVGQDGYRLNPPGEWAVLEPLVPSLSSIDSDRHSSEPLALTLVAASPTPER